MEPGEFELKPIDLTKRHCAVGRTFVNHNIDIETNKLAKLNKVLLRTVQRIKKLLCKTRNPSYDQPQDASWLVTDPQGEEQEASQGQQVDEQVEASYEARDAPIFL